MKIEDSKVKILRSYSIPIDPQVEKLTPKQLNKDISIFTSLLDKKSDENAIHDFLANHSYFFNGIIRLLGVSPLYSKIKLGSNFEVDFVCFDSGSFGPEWRLIEIESPKASLFTKSGDPTAKLSHAIRQAEDWLTWIQENREYARQIFPYIEYPLCYIFIGRRTELNNEFAKRLGRINYDYRRSLEIHTLDWFISHAKSVAGLINDNKGGTWYLPMRALSHKELNKGLPQLAKEYITNYFSSPNARLYPHEFIKMRENQLAKEDNC